MSTKVYPGAEFVCVARSPQHGELCGNADGVAVALPSAHLFSKCYAIIPRNQALLEEEIEQARGAPRKRFNIQLSATGAVIKRLDALAARVSGDHSAVLRHALAVYEELLTAQEKGESLWIGKAQGSLKKVRVP